MKTQIITALSVIAVIGAAGGAYAVNQTVLGTASSEQSVIGSATPVLVPVAPKGADIPEEYLQRIAAAAEASKTTPLGTVAGASSGIGGASTAAGSGSSSAPAGSTGDDSSAYDDDSDDDSDEVEYDDEDDDEDEDESDDDD